ncbi:MAG TPA: histidinol dehydrogenase [Kiritimatiellia bacterium]|nr:histidinol dehydrogenase [Kiritimatiellia bacterium]HMP00275.1 histidinol dehydrogenase [Kiritimatiellia bacterium]HMP96992.1 histidinol dehydrogenase [Kiritimatiellia bacterium]
MPTPQSGDSPLNGPREEEQMDKKNDKSNLAIAIAKWVPNQPSEQVLEFLNRPAFLPEAETVAREVLDDIKARGDAAVSDCIARFNEQKMAPAKFAVTKAERMATLDIVGASFKKAVQESIARVTKFSKAGLRPNWQILSPKGGMMGEQFMPLDRVGCYIPGGAAPLASTAIMTVTLAKVAGVPEIVACTPAERGGKVNPYVLYALEAAGATEIYRIGGIQAIGAMAYGTRSIRSVQKIVGPGGPYVTAAKRLVYGVVDLDLVAGPSEVAILADDTARASHIAADLLAQAEHGTGHEKALLVTSSAPLAYAVQEELLRQVQMLPPSDALNRVLTEGALLVIVDNLDIGMDLCNQFAPEHFEIIVREPRMWLKKVRRAGAVFIGPWTPECAGDFVAGPSHVLPTGGTAAMFSGLTVDAFRRRTSYISYTRADLQDVLPYIEAFAEVEQLEAHGRSAKIRFERE